jgi:hypothetical protein
MLIQISEMNKNFERFQIRCFGFLSVVLLRNKLVYV